MTTVEVYHSNGNYYYLKSVGHADSGPHEDIVCAGISTLTQTLYFTLRHFLPEDHLLDRQEEGLLEIEIRTEDPLMREKINQAFLFLITGLQLIGDSYPEYMKLNIAEVQR